jgi:hypothetical protein
MLAHFLLILLSAQYLPQARGERELNQGSMRLLWAVLCVLAKKDRIQFLYSLVLALNSPNQINF